MSFSNIIKKIFGDKSSRDLKAIRPILDKIKQEMPRWRRWTSTSCAHR